MEKQEQEKEQTPNADQNISYPDPNLIVIEATKDQNLSKEQPIDWEVLHTLVEMGFDETLSRRALLMTNDLEEAANLVVVMQENNEGKVAAPTKEQVKELFYKMVKKR
jgi:uncharacterized UBP type Zn finger protein